MTEAATGSTNAFVPIVLSVALAAMGAYAAHAGDRPGGAVIGFLLMLAAVVLAVRVTRNRLPSSARRVLLFAGAVTAAVAAFFLHAATVEAALFPQPSDVPSVSGSAASPQWTATIDRARSLARTAVVDQNLPGISIAVGAGDGSGNLLWAEGFGWRDVPTRTAMTPDTRFNIGTAAQSVTATSIASLGLTNTGTDSAADWSPGHIGEPEEDFPGFTALHEVILRPIGIGEPAKPLPGERATFYVPATFWRNDSADPRQGRRLMYMRDLACCADGKSFYSTPSDLVRFALATKPNTVNGELAGGSVVSLITRGDRGIVVAVASNISHADTAVLALKVADLFAAQK